MKENKLIAEFMGVDELKYDTDWNCLMPVVEKCYNTKESYNEAMGQESVYSIRDNN